MTSLTKLLNNLSGAAKKSNAECIVDHLVSRGEYPLTAQQEALLKRVESIDEMFTQGKFTQKEIVSIHARKFDQSESQSKRDLQDAEYIFGTTKRSNKLAKTYRHVDRIETAMIIAQRNGHIDILPKLFDALTKAIALLPDDKATNRSYPTIIMNFTSDQLGDIIKNGLSPEEADRIVAEKLRDKNIVIDLENDEYSVS